MKKKYFVLLFISLLVIVFDLGTKLYFHSEFRLGDSIAVLPNFFNFTYVRNPGAAFGFLADSHPEFRRIFFALMPPIACIVILQIFRTVKPNDRIQIYSLSLIMGGALGNYINRMYHGFVIDFLDFHLYGKYNWPAFNLADVAIVSGVGLLFLQTIKERRARIPHA